MTEEEFKKTMIKVVVIAGISLIVLVIIGFVVFYQPEKSTSIFKDQSEKDSYQNKVEQLNSHEITAEEAETIEGSEEFAEDGTTENPTPETPVEETP